MADSLLVANKLELLGNQAVSTDPRCPGAQFMLAPGFDLGSPQPTTDFVASLLTDGERIFGRRASNRKISLPIVIQAPTRAILAAARELLEETIDAQTWTLTWTRDPGPGGTALPMVLDCFRAEPTVPVYNTSYEKQARVGQLTITFQALPYGRSDVQQQISFAAPVPASPPPPPPPVVLDNFQAISSGTFSQSPRCVVGPYTACWDPDDPRVGDPGGHQTPLAYGATFPAALNLAGMTSLQLWFGLGSRYWWNLHDRSGRLKVSFYITLTDSNGVRLSFSRSGQTLPASADPANPAFSRVTVSIPQNSATFSYASVASYTLTVTSRDSTPALRWVTGYLDALTAYPASQTVTPVVRGSVYTLYGVQGTARTPVSLQFQQAPTPGTATTITTAGGGSYTVPAGTAWLAVQCIGGGGAGASQTVAGFGGGGGGGEYATETLFPAAPAQVIPYIVGAGGTSGAIPVNGTATRFGPGPAGPLAVVANGGQSAAQNSILAGLGGSGSGNSLEYPGGTGRTASGSVGGGGGSSAGPSAAGNTPMGSSAVTLSGSGSWTAPAGVTQVTVYAVGGGGGGGAGGIGSGSGGGGGGGESATQTFTVVPGTAYTYAVGAAGTGGVSSGGDNPGTAGAASTFTVAGVTLTAHGGAGSPVGGTAGGNGGTGSAAPVHYPGGAGGGEGVYSGGGGSSAGTAAAGNAGSGSGSAGIAPTGGGNGGTGSGTGGGNGNAGVFPGGGGGGCYPSATAGNGAAGTITVTYPGGAPTSNGAVAVAGGGAGGAGGGTANTPGAAGAAPGGGGGGADSSGTAEAGGAGAAGRITVTPYASLPFKNLIVHRPAPAAPAMFNPLVPVGGGTGVPNGGTEYTVPQPVTGIQADFDGTYTVVLIASAWNNPTAARTISVTFRQYETAGGAAYIATTTPVTVSPGVASTFGPGNQVNNGVLIAGVMNLPIQAVAPDNTTGYYTVAVTSSNTADRFYEVILLDSAGQTVIINEPSTGYIAYFLDEPDPTTDLGRHMGSQFGRPAAVSVMGACQAISGGPLTVPPNESTLLAYSADASAPAISVSYYSRYHLDRTQ